MGVKLQKSVLTMLRIPWEATNFVIATLEHVSTINSEMNRLAKELRLRQR